MLCDSCSKKFYSTCALPTGITPERDENGSICKCSNFTPKKKPPIGCSPYYVSSSARICELCEAIKRCSTESGKHNQIKLWAAEIQYLNEMDRMLRRVEKEKTWFEDKDGTLKEDC